MLSSPDFVKGERLLLNKSLDWTSFDAVNAVRKALIHKLSLKKIKVGHAGTLDPRATGLLIICTGKMTKQIQEYQGLDKTYEGVFRLGETTPSYDTETEPNEQFATGHITEKLLAETAQSFTGPLKQLPPMFSAVRKDGKRLYQLARKGKEIELEPRDIHISSFELTKIDLPDVHFRVKCSKGTYIRSLAYDFGKSLESGAYLKSLQRTAIGSYQLEDAMSIEEFRAMVEEQSEARA